MSWSFPLLNVRELTKCLSELSIPVSEDDIKNPQPAIIKGVYVSFADVLMGIQEENIQQPRFDAMDQFEHMDLYTDALPQLVMMAAMTKMMYASGINDFTLKDLTHPEPKRTIRNLSALINFAKFREEQLANYQALVTECDKLNHDKDAALDENEALLVKLEQYKQARKAELPQAEQLKAEVEAKAAEINQLNEIQCKLQADIRAKKDEMTNIADEVASKIFDINTKNQECTKLRSMIVQSPERISREINTLGHSLEEEKENVITAERKARETATKIDELDNNLQELLRSSKMLGEANQYANKAKGASLELDQVKEAILTTQQKLRDMAGNEQNLHRQIAMANERITRLNRQQELKREAASESLSKVQFERKQFEQDQMSAKLQAEHNERLEAEVRQEMSTLKQQHEAELSHMRLEFAHLADQVSKYNTKLLQSCQNIH